jgi:hypothetical protein
MNTNDDIFKKLNQSANTDYNYAKVEKGKRRGKTTPSQYIFRGQFHLRIKPHQEQGHEDIF